MTLYSLYIFDRHCACIYYHDWNRITKPNPVPEGNILPGVSRAVISSTTTDGPQERSSNLLTTNSGVVVAVGGPQTPMPGGGALQSQQNQGLPFDEEAKLVFGLILSLRSMIKKLSGKDENFTGYNTSTYRLHLFETLSGYKFVLFTDPTVDSMRFVLKQIYAGPFVEYVARNPLMDMDSKEHGIDNEHFRNATDRLIRTLSVFQ